MGLFGKLTSAIVQTALLPVELAKDCVTFPARAEDGRDLYTVRRLKKLGRTVEDAIDDLND